MKLVFQKSNGQIVFERCYQQLDGDLDFWTDKVIEEVRRFGKNIKVVLINKPLKVEFCPNHKGTFSQTIDEPATKRIIASDWSEKSIATVYTNPKQASLAILIHYNDEVIYSVNIHRCCGRLRMCDYKGSRSAKIRLFCVRKQVKYHVEKLLKDWGVGMVFYGTGNPDRPVITEECVLPLFWEFRDVK